MDLSKLISPDLVQSILLKVLDGVPKEEIARLQSFARSIPSEYIGLCAHLKKQGEANTKILEQQALIMLALNIEPQKVLSDDGPSNQNRDAA